MSVSVAEAPVYTSRIIKASALLADTRALLLAWDPAVSAEVNLAGARRENIFGKASRARVEDVLRIFRQRYVDEPAVAPALAILARAHLPAHVLDRILYFHAARSDRLLHDVAADFLADRYERGQLEISSIDLQGYLSRLVAAGLTAGEWSAPTCERIAQGLLATLRDFGVLTGAVRKRLQAPYLAPEAFAYIAFALERDLRSGNAVVTSSEWRLFFLSASAVEQRFIEAQQYHLLTYQAAGSIVRIDFPAETLEDYARALAQRAH